MSIIKSVTAALTLVALAGTTLPANASDDNCTSAPSAEWRTKDEATAAADALGYKVSRMKVEDSCYEAYAHDKDGRRVEIYIDPMTLKVVRVKDKS